MAFPPPIHSYQRGMVRNGEVNGFWPSTSNVKAVASSSDSPSSSTSVNQKNDVSPIAELHQALLSQKRASQAADAMAAATSSSTSSLSSTPFVSTAQAFPTLSSSTGRCAVHAVPDLNEHDHTYSHSHSHSSSKSSVVAASSSSCAASRSSSSSSHCHLPRASFWNTRCSCIFSALPDELLLFNVFSFLTVGELAGVARVSSRWKFLSTDRLLWRQLDLSPHSRSIDSTSFDGVMSRVGPDISSLKLCNLKLLDGMALKRLGEEHLLDNNGKHYLEMLTSLFAL